MSKLLRLSTHRITSEKMSPKLLKEVAAVRAELRADHKADVKVLREAHPECKTPLDLLFMYEWDFIDYAKEIFEERVLELVEKEKAGLL